MKNTIKLIAAGAIAMTAIYSASAQTIVGQKDSQSFVGSMKITPGKYLNIAFGNSTVSETINPVTIAGTVITQNTDSGSATVSSTVRKITNASILNSIFGGNATAARGYQLVWVIEGAGTFASGQLGALKSAKSGNTISYDFVPAESDVFYSDEMIADLVVSNKKTATKNSVTTTTTNYSAGVYNIDILDIPSNGVGTIIEVDSTNTLQLNVTVTLPLSGTSLVTEE